MENKKIADIIIKQIHLFSLAAYMEFCSDYGMNFPNASKKFCT